ncbi:MAG TPA: carboxylesterase/lipase family protein [Rhizomicrobium sp.]|jgi:para-nitrobenzyl esterase|nr:carboxylesterase/lipase family protein [Rhizomicrobium sp.]
MTPVSRRTLLALTAATLAAPTIVRAADTTPIATTRAGKVRGTSDQSIAVFKGIRYGADTSATRFQPPRLPKPWPGIADALAYGPACPQGRDDEHASEDCLFLNVWTPALRDGGRRPVMVYIHGGAYSNGSGSSPLYDGVNLCRRGNVVVVTLNHRLNAFGYLYLARLDNDFPDSGNAGQFDLVQALTWVKDNIAEFGGDPNCVMVFGQSGGGAKIATLMATPAAKGLFHRAATMSGQQVTASGPFNATKRAQTYMAALNLTPDKTKDLLKLPTAQLVAALKATDPVIGSGGVYFGPVLDERTLTRHPFYPDAPAQSADIPMMIGNTHDETRLFIQDAWAATLTWDDLPARLAPNYRVDLDPETVIAKYREWFPNITPTEMFYKATTAGRSWRAAIIEDELRAQAGTPAYAYEVDFQSPIDGGKWHAPHTIDIALAFDNTDQPGALAGNGPEARALAAQMSETFIAFARTGNPNNKTLPQWTPYTLPNRETMIFDTTSHMENDPRGRERELFARVPFIQQGT